MFQQYQTMYPSLTVEQFAQYMQQYAQMSPEQYQQYQQQYSQAMAQQTPGYEQQAYDMGGAQPQPMMGAGQTQEPELSLPPAAATSEGDELQAKLPPTTEEEPEPEPEKPKAAPPKPKVKQPKVKGPKLKKPKSDVAEPEATGNVCSKCGTPIKEGWFICPECKNPIV
jgi:hypothetical protein